MDKVMVVDDDSEIRNIIGIYLKNNGCEVEFACNGKEAIDKIDDSYDLIILDIMMPEMDGMTALPIIRQNYNTPVIFLSAKGSEMDKIQGIMTGADDYIVKPFTPMELVVRVKASLRRYKILGSKHAITEIKAHKILHIHDLEIDVAGYEVKKGGKLVKLTKTEFEILLLLSRNRGQVFNSETILNHIFDDTTTVVGSNSIAVHIRNLRSKIEGDQNNPKIILNIWGVGYKIEK
jgi:DNA-binding response OmpR family regulator